MLEALLTILFVLVLIHAIIIVLAYFWEWFYAAPTRQDETSYLLTDDGWRLAVHRYRPESAVRGHPVILCHGMISNRYTFDLPAAASLARFLKENGRDVWVPELRGSGMSAKPGLFRSDVPYSWQFEDLLRRDLPAVIRHVLARTGAPALHWVGHSMGGLLIEAHMAANDDPHLASATVIASPCDFSKVRNESFQHLLRLKWLLKLYPIFPLPFVGRFLIPFAHRLWNHSTGPFYPPNIEPQTARRVIALASESITSKKLWLEAGAYLGSGLVAPDTGRGYMEGLSNSRVPLMALAGSRDEMAPEPAVRPACETNGNPVERKCMTFGKTAGCGEDYGHVDLLVGKRVESEVFPVVLRWLETHDSTEAH